MTERLPVQWWPTDERVTVFVGLIPKYFNVLYRNGYINEMKRQRIPCNLYQSKKRLKN